MDLTLHLSGMGIALAELVSASLLPDNDNLSTYLTPGFLLAVGPFHRVTSLLTIGIILSQSCSAFFEWKIYF